MSLQLSREVFRGATAEGIRVGAYDGVVVERAGLAGRNNN